MKYEKTLKYDTDLINQKIMGPNPLKLEELMKDNKIKRFNHYGFRKWARHYICFSSKGIWI